MWRSYFTEKTSHSIWACTIPISFSYGAYTDLERLGFDCFRDIVDTTGEYKNTSIFKEWAKLLENYED